MVGMRREATMRIRYEVAISESMAIICVSQIFQFDF